MGRSLTRKMTTRWGTVLCQRFSGGIGGEACNLLCPFERTPVFHAQEGVCHGGAPQQTCSIPPPSGSTPQD